MYNYRMYTKYNIPRTVLLKIHLGARWWKGPRAGFTLHLLRKNDKYLILFLDNTMNIKQWTQHTLMALTNVQTCKSYRQCWFCHSWILRLCFLPGWLLLHTTPIFQANVLWHLCRCAKIWTHKVFLIVSQG